MTVSIQKLIEQHQEAKAKLSHYQAEEKKLRLKIIDSVFPNAIEGTHNHLYKGYEIKGTFKINHRIDVKALDLSALSEAEQECIVMKPNLALKEYKALDASERETLDKAIIASPALPSIVINKLES